MSTRNNNEPKIVIIKIGEEISVKQSYNNYSIVYCNEYNPSEILQKKNENPANVYLLMPNKTYFIRHNALENISKIFVNYDMVGYIYSDILLKVRNRYRPIFFPTFNPYNSDIIINCPLAYRAELQPEFNEKLKVLYSNWILKSLWKQSVGYHIAETLFQCDENLNNQEDLEVIKNEWKSG